MDTTHDQLQMQGIDPLQDKRFLVRKRDGRIEEFNEARILLAIECAFKACHGLGPDAPLPDSAQAAANHCAGLAVKHVLGCAVRGAELEVERIQNMVEDQLMLAGHLEAARRYILYREKRRLARAAREGRVPPSPPPGRSSDAPAAAPDAAPSELNTLYSHALPAKRDDHNFEALYRRHFDAFLNEAEYGRSLSPELLELDSDSLARGLRWERDQQFGPARLEALWERYLIRQQGRCLETPQFFWMRIAMGLALNEPGQQEARALDFYEALSTFRFIPSDLILRNAGTPHPALVDDSQPDSSSSWIEPWCREICGPLPAGELWLPDLFMKRVRQQASWCLFDPAETGDLHDCCGSAFDNRYLAYEQKAERGGMRFARRVKAVEIWRQIVDSLASAGQPRLVFKDAVALRSPRPDLASATGPLGAINLAAHVSESSGQLDVALLCATISSAVRMLDNALDLSLYPTQQARLDALEHRVMGLGIAGFQEALGRLHLDCRSAAAADFADRSMESVSCRAIMASCELACERGPFPGYSQSHWRKGILPMDILDQLSQQRALPVDIPAGASQDWASVRDMIRLHGMRNSVITAFTSLDTPAKIAGITPSIDPAPPGKSADPKWSIEYTARLQKWIDMDQTLTLHAPEKDPGKLADLCMLAWEKGIKTLRQVSLPAPPSQKTKPVKPAALANSVA